MLNKEQRQQWREDVHRLNGFPLLPCGGGASGKAPLIKSWPTASCSPEEVLATPGLRSVGIRLGPDAGGLVCVDFDGASAIDHAACFGHDARAFTTWVIGRDSDADRLKAIYRVDENDWETLPGKTVHTTGPGEQVEVFFSSGQVIVLGEHVPSGDQYRWLHGGPESIEPLPAALAAMWFDARSHGSRCQTTPPHGGGEWRDCVPCTICGRTEPDCRISGDGRTIACHRGVRWKPPFLKPGQTINRGNTSWAYCGETQTAVGAAALFKIDETQVPLRKKPMVPPSEGLRLMSQELHGAPRLNVRTRAIHVDDQVFTAEQAANVYLGLSQRGRYCWPKQLAVDCLTALAAKNEFDPVRDYLDSIRAEPLPMEQWDRLDRLLCGIEDGITAAFFKRYLVSAVQRVYEPGCPQRILPVLVGAQAIGKTSLGAALFGVEFYGDAVSGNAKLDTDDITAMSLTWCTELAELDGLTRKAQTASLKAFVSRTHDLIRRKYHHGSERVPRRSVLFGTSNQWPLNDPTGSTRFCLISLGKKPLPFNEVARLRDNIWARDLVQYRDGYQPFPTAQEAKEIAERNACYDPEDPLEPKLRRLVERKASAPYICLDEVLDFIGADPTGSPQLSARLNVVMAQLGWVKKRQRFHGKKVSAYWPAAREGRDENA